jgi:hypothetical protein
MMINSISGSQSNKAIEEAQTVAKQPQPQSTNQAESTALPKDTVTLTSTGDKSAGDPDHDGK